MKTKASLLEEHVEELIAKYNELRFICKADKSSVRGRIIVEAEYENKNIICDYRIDIRIPENYPASVPKVFELQGKIDSGFHKMEDGELCLGAPQAVSATFHQNRTLLGFVEENVVPYLFAHACYVETSEMPFGELDHGNEGICQYYYEKFKTYNATQITNYLKSLLELEPLENKNILCFCGSGRRFSECHILDYKYYYESLSIDELVNIVLEVCDSFEEVKKEKRREFEKTIIRTVYFGPIRRVINTIMRCRKPLFYFDEYYYPLNNRWYEEIRFQKPNKESLIRTDQKTRF